MLSWNEIYELDEALRTVRLLIDYDAAARVTFEWKLGEHPKVTFTPTVPLEYIMVNFTVQDTPKDETENA